LRSLTLSVCLSAVWMTAACAATGRGDGAGSRMSPGPRTLIAHRGASGYAPEHTRAAYELAIAQGADFIEPDLQITKDGKLIALHDLTLERTTNVEDVFPDRFREEVARGKKVRHWYANDFTLAEIERLDAGSWFDPEFSGARILTLDQVIDIARGRAGIYPETKAPDVYGEKGFDMERLLVADLAAHGLDHAGADPKTPVVIQSFSAESLTILRRDLGSDLPSTFLLSGAEGAEWLTPDKLTQVREFATGIGPEKSLLLEHPDAVAQAHAAGLVVIAWTFSASDPGPFPSVGLEMAHYLYELGIDGLFTNNPDLFPRKAPAGAS
jgi:glycerophosphoryl diester phosphodiesterase